MLLNYLELCTYEKLKNIVVSFFLPKELNVRKRDAPRDRISPWPVDAEEKQSGGVSLGHVADIPPLLSPGLRDKTGKEARPFGDRRWLEEGSASSGS